MSDPIFNPAGPFASGLAPNLIPNPPSEIPAPSEIGDAVQAASPFTEAQSVDDIIANLTLDRPLKLFIPEDIKRRFPTFEFRVINSIPGEFAAAKNKGFREVTDPDAVALFNGLVAGTDKTGAAFRPVLMARPKEVGEHVRRQNRKQLQSLYAGMDPKNKELGGKYTSGVDAKDGTFLQREGAPWRIRVG